MSSGTSLLKHPAVTQHGGPTSCGLGVRQAFCPFLRGGHPVRCELWEAGSWESWRSVCCRGVARNHTAQPGLHISSCVFCPLVRGEVRHTLKGWTVRCDGRWAQGGAGVGVYHTPRGLTTVFWTARMARGGGWRVKQRPHPCSKFRRTDQEEDSMPSRDL